MVYCSEYILKRWICKQETTKSDAFVRIVGRQMSLTYDVAKSSPYIIIVLKETFQAF